MRARLVSSCSAQATYRRILHGAGELHVRPHQLWIGYYRCLAGEEPLRSFNCMQPHADESFASSMAPVSVEATVGLLVVLNCQLRCRDSDPMASVTGFARVRHKPPCGDWLGPAGKRWKPLIADPDD